jgi:hypothetical protein
MAIELQEQLLSQERELDSREGALMAQENGSAASKCTLGSMCTKCNTKCVRAKAVRQDYEATTHAFVAGCRHSCTFD